LKKQEKSIKEKSKQLGAPKETQQFRGKGEGPKAEAG